MKQIFLSFIIYILAVSLLLGTYTLGLNSVELYEKGYNPIYILGSVFVFFNILFIISLLFQQKKG